MKQYESRVIAFAHKLANTLEDTESLNAYLQYADKYSEDYLQKVLDKAMSIPHHQIRKSRGALFTYLINSHGKKEHFRS